MRILHLGYEDPAQPGSGGGSVRTREINRRLSSRHEITIVTAGYPGATARVEDGIRWEPLGPRSGLKLDRLAYFALLAPAIRRHAHDLLVEDFGAPFSTAFSPLFTRQPVIASVQWLFASQMSQKYHLPFDRVEALGLPLYKNFIVVSDWLRRAFPPSVKDARIAIIPNGIEDAAFAVQPAPPKHLLFIGRLDRLQKGCDLLIQIAARTRALLGSQMPPLVIVGDGPDRAAMEQEVQRLGLDDVVELRGRVEGTAKYELMAGAYAVLMPSRFETFGMVAVESQAAGAPLVAFDVGPLREVAGPGGARLVPAFDVEAFARETARLVVDQAETAHVRQAGRRWARRYNWDVIAEEQEAVYLEAAGRRQSALAQAA